MTDRVAETPGRPGTSALRVGLALGGIVLAAVVIFGLGVLEGSRVAERVPEFAAPPSALPTETLQPQPAAPPAPATALQPDKLTFYDRLSGIAPASPLALPEGQPPVQGTSPAPPASPGPRARQPEAPPPPATAVAAPPKTPAATTAKAPVPSNSDPAAQIRRLAGKGRFSVQMAAVSERAAAAETAALIKRHGFEAVTVMASVKGRILYRIRVGNFPSKTAAAQAAKIFHTAFGLNAIPVEN